MYLLRKFTKGLLALIMVFSLFTFNTSNVSAAEKSNENSLSQQEIIDIADPYVKFEDGNFYLVNEKELHNQLSQQEMEMVKLLISKGNENLATKEIEEVNGNAVTVKSTNQEPQALAARCNVDINWNYHWWGYDENFSNCEADAMSDYWATVAGGAGIITGASVYVPPVAAVAGVTTGYASLVTARINANNNGNGVYIAVTWVAVFNIRPL